jgi:2-polyprenyl-3-methyl-5-hydroxy-6-metoxy-1,4-benzoquinol methylase
MAESKYDTEIDLANSETSHAKIVELVGSNKRVLDVGCATGYLAQVLGTFGNTVSGVEYAAAAAEQARPHLADLVIGDVETVDLVAELGEGQFDVVVYGDVLEHLRDPLPVLRQARRLLAAGGSVVISVPNIAHGDVRLALLSGRFEYGKLGLLDETHTRFFTRDSLEAFVRDAGFAAVDIRRTTAELFSTEIGVRAEDYDPALIEEIRRDPEATTYQFVVRAVRDDAHYVNTELGGRIERHEQRIAELEGENERLRAAVAGAAAERAAAAERVAALEQELTAHRTELDRVYQTRLWRAARLPRALYGGGRRGQGDRPVGEAPADPR